MEHTIKDGENDVWQTAKGWSFNLVQSIAATKCKSLSRGVYLSHIRTLWSSSFLIFKVDYSCHIVKTLQLYLNNKLYY